MMSVTLFGIASLASAVAPSLGFLAGTRFFTGAGIAGGFAGTVALTGDYTPQRLRAMMIMLTFTGAPLGGFVGGQVVSLLLSEGLGWPIIFVIGGAFPLVLLAITALWLPESPRFLAARANLAPHQRALLHRLAIAPSPGETHAIDFAKGNPLRLLFGEGFALQTTLLWIIFFCSLLDLFLFVFWLPEVLHLGGLTPAQSVFASSLFGLGGIVAVLYLGWAIVFISLIALAALPYRTRGYGFATGVGRLGGIAAAPLGGFLLAHGLPPTFVFLSPCLFAAIAAVATALLALPGRQPSASPAIEAT